MNYKVIASSSSGNSVLLNDEFLVDIGIPFKILNKNINIDNIKALFITHIHGDHLKLPTLNKLLEENPLIKIFCNDEVGRKLIDNNIKCNILVHNKTFKLNIKGTQNKYELRPVNLFHDIDVKTYGMKLFIEDMFGNNTKIFYATDTGNVDGIIAKGYDYFFIEGNYDEDYLMDYEFREDEFNRRFRTISFHLSKQEAHQFFIDNRKEDSELIILHKSQRFYR